MSDSHIFIDYRDTLRKADRLEELGRALDRLARNEMRDTVSGVSSQWKGDSGDSFAKKGIRLSDKASAHAAELIRAAEGLRAAARRYQMLEESAHAIFG